MSYPPRTQSTHRASITSIASSTDDDHLPSAAYTYSYGPPPSSTGSISPPASPTLHSRTSSTCTNRSRARRLSLLGSPLPHASARRESDAFGGQAYDDALEPDEEEGLGYEFEEVDTGGGKRETFQPLTSEEEAWMGVSAGVVLALTVLSCVVTAVA